MSEQPNLVDKLRSKDLLWFASIFVILLGLFGIGYGIWITYNGILLKGVTDGPTLEALEKLGMTLDDGVNAFILFGSCLIILYGLILGAGILGYISSSHLLIKKSIFWLSIFLLVVEVIFWVMGIVGLVTGIVSTVLLGFFSFCLIRKYNIDYSKYKKRRRNGR